MINSKLVNVNKTNTAQDNPKATLKTINGVNKTDGMITIKAKIFNIEKEIDIFIVNNESFNSDFIIGLDMIEKFQLIQDEKLNVTQKIPEYTGKNIQKKDQKDDIETQKFRVNFNEFINTYFEININHLTIDKKSIIDEMLEEYKSMFAKNKYDIGTVKNYEARIDLITEKYCSKPPYRCSQEDREEINGQIKQLLNHALIEDTYSPFAAPVTLDYKKDEDKKSRLCMDFRDLNKLVVPQAQPFPLIDDLIEKTVDCRYFSSLDVNSAYWSIPLRVEDRHKTAFVTQDGHYQWTSLPFGLKTAPAIFQRILSNVIRKYNLSNFAVNYIDDILIFSKTFKEHVSHIKQLLEALKIEGFRLKFTKCTFASDSAKYLGHIIGYNNVSPLKDNLKSVREFPIPQTQKNVRQFLGKINFYNKYIPNSSIILDPLHNLLRKNQKFRWSGDCQNSFDKIKDLLCSQPILTIFNPKLPINIYTDASIKGVAAILKQPQEHEEKPVAYFSMKLKEAQKKRRLYI